MFGIGGCEEAYGVPYFGCSDATRVDWGVKPYKPTQQCNQLSACLCLLFAVLIFDIFFRQN